MFRPWLHLDEENKIDSFKTVDRDLWTSNPIKAAKVAWNKRDYKWIVAAAPYSAIIVFYLAVSLLGKKTVFYTSYPEWQEPTNREIPLLRILIRKLWKIYLDHENTTIVTVTTTSKKSLENQTGAEVDQIIPHSCDTSTFKNRKETKDKQVLFVGKLIEKKRIDIVLELAQNNPEIDFKICGKGPLEERVMNVEESIDNLEYEGFVKDDGRLSSIYSESSLLILPSKQEYFGCVVIESLACGTPVLSTSNAGPKDIITSECGFLAKGEYSDFQEKLRLAMNEKDLQKLGKNGGRRVKDKYGLAIVAGRWQKILESI